MSVTTEQDKPEGSLLVRDYEPRDWQYVLPIYTDGVMGMVVGIAFKGLKHHPESLLLYFLITVVCLLLTQSWWMLAIVPAFVLCARYYYSRLAIQDYLEEVLSTDFKDIDEYYTNSTVRRLWVAELDGKVVGLVAALGDETTRTVELHRMSVDKGFRRNGIAIALGKKVLQFGVDQNYSIAKLGTESYSQAVHRLYLGLGFKLVGPQMATTNPEQHPHYCIGFFIGSDVITTSWI